MRPICVLSIKSNKKAQTYALASVHILAISVYLPAVSPSLPSSVIIIRAGHIKTLLPFSGRPYGARCSFPPPQIMCLGRGGNAEWPHKRRAPRNDIRFGRSHNDGHSRQNAVKRKARCNCRSYAARTESHRSSVLPQSYDISTLCSPVSNTLASKLD
jgi:hypothetical protein